MKEKIFNALKQAYSPLGLGDAILTSLSETADATGLVTDVNLETYVKAQEKGLKQIQTALDKERTDKTEAAKKLAEKEAELAKMGGSQTKPTETNPSDEPDWFKAFKEAQAKELQTLKQENEAFKSERTKAEHTSKILAKAKELEIPEWRVKEGFNIPGDADETAIATALAGVKQNLVAAGLEGRKDSFPMTGTTEAMKAEAEDWAKSLPDKK